MGLTRSAGLLTAIVSQPYPGKLPARFRRKKIAVGGANVRARRGTRSATQDHLSAHEFAVVFTQRAGRGLIAGIWKIGACCPLPYIAKQLQWYAAFQRRRSRRGMKSAVFQKIALDGGNSACRDFPLELGRQARTGPAGKRVRFVITHMADRLGFFNVAHAGAGELDPLAAGLFPIERCLPAMRLHSLPAIREP